MLEQGLALHPNHLDVIRTLSRNYAQQVALLSGRIRESVPPRKYSGCSPAGSQGAGIRRSTTLCFAANEFGFPTGLGSLARIDGRSTLRYWSREEEAWQDYLRAQKILEGLAAESPTPKVLLALYDSHYRLISIKVTRRDLAGATSDARSALDIGQQVEPRRPPEHHALTPACGQQVRRL